jgi:hypothetical protein
MINTKKISNFDYLAGKTPKEQKDIIKSAFVVNNEIATKTLIDFFVNKEADYIAKYSKNWEDIITHRGIIYALIFIADELEKLSSIYLENENKNNIIEEDNLL